jgi:hypothetical protein
VPRISGREFGRVVSSREVVQVQNVLRHVALPSNGFLVSLAVLLALLHATMAVTATVEKSMTADEIAHLTAGLVYNTKHDYRLQPENGNVPQRWAALPMTIADVPLPPTTSKGWDSTNIWDYGPTLFYGQGILADQWLFLGRSMIALVSAATGLIVFFWSRALFGWRGGFTSLVLFAFSPAFLTHGALATSDLLMTFFFVASVGAWWRHLERPGFKWGMVSSLTLGLACVAKFSAVLLPLMLGLIGIGWAVGETRKLGWRKTILRLSCSIGIHSVVAWAVIWTCYGFRFSAFAPELQEDAHFDNGWGWALNGIGLAAPIIWWLKQWQLLPEAWLYGLSFVLNFARARSAFLSGEYSITGWVNFFPFTFLVKTTLPFLLLLTFGLVAAGFRAKRLLLEHGAFAFVARLRPFLPLAVLFAVYWATSLASNLNIGHRHILPTYPVLFIAAGWLGQWWNIRKPLAVVCITALLSWHVGESLRVRPNYLAYFNQIVGGPQNGWKHLVDSSLDWGQELPRLSRWLAQNARGENVYLSYFGTGNPTYEGIKATTLPSLPEVGPARKWHALSPGTYAISATMLQHVYSPFRGEWTAQSEKEYQQLRPLEPMMILYQDEPAKYGSIIPEVTPENVTLAWKRYEQLRFARLCYYLRVREADAVIGHSILIYRLDAAELNGALRGSLKTWRELIQRAALQRRTSGRSQ